MTSRMGLAATAAGCTKGALASHVHWQKVQSAFRTGRHNPTFIVLLLSTSSTVITKGCSCGLDIQSLRVL